MDRLRLVAAAGERRERAAAQQAHAVLRVAHVAARGRLEEPARRAVGNSALERHLREVAEAVADDELGVLRGGEERRDRVCRVLAVGVEHEHGVGADRPRDSEANRRALAPALR